MRKPEGNHLQNLSEIEQRVAINPSLRLFVFTGAAGMSHELCIHSDSAAETLTGEYVLDHCTVEEALRLIEFFLNGSQVPADITAALETELGPRYEYTQYLSDVFQAHLAKVVSHKGGNFSTWQALSILEQEDLLTGEQLEKVVDSVEDWLEAMVNVLYSIFPIADIDQNNKPKLLRAKQFRSSLIWAEDQTLEITNTVVATCMANAININISSTAFSLFRRVIKNTEPTFAIACCPMHPAQAIIELIASMIIHKLKQHIDSWLLTSMIKLSQLIEPREGMTLKRLAAEGPGTSLFDAFREEYRFAFNVDLLLAVTWFILLNPTSCIQSILRFNRKQLTPNAIKALEQSIQLLHSSHQALLSSLTATYPDYQRVLGIFNEIDRTNVLAITEQEASTLANRLSMLTIDPTVLHNFPRAENLIATLRNARMVKINPPPKVPDTDPPRERVKIIGIPVKWLRRQDNASDWQKVEEDPSNLLGEQIARRICLIHDHDKGVYLVNDSANWDTLESKIHEFVLSYFSSAGQKRGDNYIRSLVREIIKIALAYCCPNQEPYPMDRIGGQDCMYTQVKNDLRLLLAEVTTNQLGESVFCLRLTDHGHNGGTGAKLGITLSPKQMEIIRNHFGPQEG